MDPGPNPCAPGAGTPSPELAGRDRAHPQPAGRKGMVWSPGHGDTAFTVPMFDSFMRRIMPHGWDID